MFFILLEVYDFVCMNALQNYKRERKEKEMQKSRQHMVWCQTTQIYFIGIQKLPTNI